MKSLQNPYDIFSFQAQGNHPLYEQMRQEDPVHCATEPLSGKAFWFLTRYEDCVNFMKDKRFGKEYPKHFGLEGNLSKKDVINQHMLNMDEPQHGRLKSLVHKAFSPGRIQTLRLSIQAIADKLLAAIDDEVADGEAFDLSACYTSLLPLISLATMLGIPDNDYSEYSFDILRTPNKHIAFSQGIHHCLGEPLARLEGENYDCEPIALDAESLVNADTHQIWRYLQNAGYL